MKLKYFCLGLAFAYFFMNYEIKVVRKERAV